MEPQRWSCAELEDNEDEDNLRYQIDNFWVDPLLPSNLHDDAPSSSNSSISFSTLQKEIPLCLELPITPSFNSPRLSTPSPSPSPSVLSLPTPPPSPSLLPVLTGPLNNVGSQPSSSTEKTPSFVGSQPSSSTEKTPSFNSPRLSIPSSSPLSLPTPPPSPSLLPVLTGPVNNVVSQPSSSTEKTPSFNSPRLSTPSPSPSPLSLPTPPPSPSLLPVLTGPVNVGSQPSSSTLKTPSFNSPRLSTPPSSPSPLALPTPPPSPSLLPVLTGPVNNVASQPSSSTEKLKADNFDISTILIGAWKRESMRDGDLKAKVYYARKKLLWEVLDELIKKKKKMEMVWSDITAINAIMLEGQRGILQIELSKPPLFFEEKDLIAKKHSSWEKIDDFTGGQALQHRRHIAIFAPGVLEKQYEKLIQCDKRLFELSQKPFSSQQSSDFNMDQSFHLRGPTIKFNGPGPTHVVAQHDPFVGRPTINSSGPGPRHVPPMSQHYSLVTTPTINCSGPRPRHVPPIVQHYSFVGQSFNLRPPVNFNGPCPRLMLPVVQHYPFDAAAYPTTTLVAPSDSAIAVGGTWSNKLESARSEEEEEKK